LPTPDTGRILFADDVAELLGIQPRTVGEWARTGKIPGFKLGRGWLFYEDLLHSHLRQEADLQERHR
jgi:excisionase family DNA binding protein